MKGSVESKVEGGKFGEEEKLECPKNRRKGLRAKGLRSDLISN